MKIVNLVLSILALVIGGFALWSSLDNADQIEKLQNEIKNVSGFNEDLYIDDDAILGDRDAPITIVEWSDYQCPFCRRHFNETFSRIVTEYVDTGLAKYVFRDFPLRSHKDAIPAANAAECARKQGGDEVYFEYHNKIFSGQNELGLGTVEIPESSLTTYAEELGLDVEEFMVCQNSFEFEDEIYADLQDGVDFGIQGTPGFVIQGKVLSGAQPFSTFKRLIDRELEKLED